MSGNNDVEKTVQEMNNRSFDKAMDINAVEVMGYDGSALQRLKVNSSGELVVNIDPLATTQICSTKAVSTAAAIATTSAIKQILIQADHANTDGVLIGSATNQYIKLYAGDNITIEIDDIAKVYAKSVAGTQNINYITLA